MHGLKNIKQTKNNVVRKMMGKSIKLIDIIHHFPYGVLTLR